MIDLQAVTKRYGAAVVLRDVSLTIAEGEFFALLGPNGAGKTTIIRILLDFTRPTSGAARICGIPSTEAAARARVGYLPENMRLPSYLSGLRYLRRQAALCGIEGKQRETAVEKMLELVGMTGKAGQPSGTYSKGMLQRIGLAGALLGSPRVLILDEPTTGLDPVGIREFRLILERVKIDRVTVLLNSHVLSEVEKLCTTAAILNNGGIVVKDSIANLVGDGATLEDVFVKYVGG
jgi:ABC-2 type transport system ATP-binding protein